MAFLMEPRFKNTVDHKPKKWPTATWVNDTVTSNLEGTDTWSLHVIMSWGPWGECKISSLVFPSLVTGKKQPSKELCFLAEDLILSF